MPVKKPAIIFVLVALAAIAAAVYFSRGYRTPAQPAGGGYQALGVGSSDPKICYVCPMHKQIVRDKPGDCPICGMTLVKKVLPAEGAKKLDEMSGMGGMAKQESAGALKGLGQVSLDPRQRMLANVATAMVMHEDASQDVYTVGKVAYDEKTLRRVTARFPGRIERLYVNFTGERVEKGAPIMSIYSPELLTTQREYLVAKETSERLKSSGFSEISGATAEVLESARTKMMLWGLTGPQIDELDRTGKPQMRAEVYSPVSGTVVEVMAREGEYLQEGSEIYKLADLSTVWVLAEVYEYEFSKVRVGGVIEVTADAWPGRTFTGRVSFMDPVVNPESRTVRVRAELKNPGGLLKPEMFVNAKVLSPTRRVLTVPSTAILYTGKTNRAWVEVKPGVFEPREVRLGARFGDAFEVLSGLKDGDMVATQGGFLIDSEAQLMQSGGGMAGMDMGPGPEEKAAPKEKGGMAGMPGM